MQGEDMIIAKVIGTAVSTLKDQQLDNMKLLVVSRAGTHGEVIEEPFIAVDLVGAGEEELVFIAQGSTARLAVGSSGAPVDAAIVGILDSLSCEGHTTFVKR
jgi:microcompartment protein CcmK/EutM